MDDFYYSRPLTHSQLYAEDTFSMPVSIDQGVDQGSPEVRVSTVEGSFLKFSNFPSLSYSSTLLSPLRTTKNRALFI